MGTDRYDRYAELYALHWAPVLAPAASRLLDRVDPWVRAAIRERGTLHLLDLGTGTGALALEAAHRWPGATITAIDASRAMLAVARRRAREAGADGRIEWHAVEADRLPLGDASVDLVVSSFVVQLVPDRTAVLRELLRVLRPRGRFAFVTWLEGREHFRPAEEFDEAVLDLAIEEEEALGEQRAGDFTSTRAAERELRRAGFRNVRADPDQLDQAWSREAWLAYKVGYDELDLFEDLDTDTAERLRARVDERLAALDDADFRWQAPLVQVRADRP